MNSNYMINENQTFRNETKVVSNATINGNTDFAIQLGVKQGTIEGLSLVPSANTTYSIQIFEKPDKQSDSLIYHAKDCVGRLDDLIGLHFRADYGTIPTLFARLICNTSATTFNIKTTGKKAYSVGNLKTIEHVTSSKFLDLFNNSSLDLTNFGLVQNTGGTGIWEKVTEGVDGLQVTSNINNINFIYYKTPISKFIDQKVEVEYSPLNTSDQNAFEVYQQIIPTGGTMELMETLRRFVVNFNFSIPDIRGYYVNANGTLTEIFRKAYALATGTKYKVVFETKITDDLKFKMSVFSSGGSLIVASDWISFSLVKNDDNPLWFTLGDTWSSAGDIDCNKKYTLFNYSV